MGVRENIRKQIESLGYKGRESKFAEDNGLSKSYLNEVLNGKKAYNERWLGRIAKALKVDIDVLLSSGPVEIKSPAMKFNMPEGDYVPVKLFSDPAVLGPGYDMREFRPEGHIAILKKHLPIGFSSPEDRIVCFPTTGISMKPTINPDSFVWIDRDVPCENVVEGGIYAFLLPDDGVTIKRLIVKNAEHLIIDADNQDREERALGELRGFPMALKIPGPDDPRIVLGKVIWILNRLVPKE